MIELKGIAASSGIAVGDAYLFANETVMFFLNEVVDPEREIRRFTTALEDSKRQIQSLLEEAEKKVKHSAKIFDAHLLILEDSTLLANVTKKMAAGKMSAEAAVKRAIEENVKIFSSMSDPVFQSKTADIRDIGNRLLKNLSGKDPDSLEVLKEKAILVAQYLTPSDTIHLDKERVLGFATDEGGVTSHTAIIAREFKLPAVVGLGIITKRVRTGDQLIIDGARGLVVINPTEKVLKDYLERRN